MSATKLQFNEIRKLIAEQEKIGVISGTTQTAGVQELATYLTQEQSIKKLLPVMNDMLAQQYGLNLLRTSNKHRLHARKSNGRTNRSFEPLRI